MKERKKERNYSSFLSSGKFGFFKIPSLVAHPVISRWPPFQLSFLKSAKIGSLGKDESSFKSNWTPDSSNLEMFDYYRRSTRRLDVPEKREGILA